jgi:hypothetical protein
MPDRTYPPLQPHAFHCSHCGRKATYWTTPELRVDYTHTCPGPMTAESGADLPQDTKYRVTVRWGRYACHYKGSNRCAICKRYGEGH